MANYDIIGSIAIIKFEDKNKISKEDKLKEARRILEEHKNVKTVLEKTEKVSGRLRTIKTKYILGEKTLFVVHKENGCIFRLNVEECYFSPRLSNDRIDVANIIRKKKNSNVLVMFSGVGPYTIVIAKNSNVKKVVSIELGKECCKYASENIRLNKVYGKAEVIQGDVKKVIPKIAKGRLSVKGNLVPLQFDFIVMARPNLKESFLKQALDVSKKGTIIFYHAFCNEKDIKNVLIGLEKEAKKCKKKIKILNTKEIGDIAPYKHRYRVDMIVC